MRSLLGDAQPVGDHAAVVEQIAMREQHALGRSGGAGGVLNVDHVVAIGRAGSRVDAARDHPVPRFFAKIDDVPQREVLAGRPPLREFLDSSIAHRRRAAPAPSCRIFQHIRQLMRSIRRIDVDLHQSGARAAELQVNPFGAVGGPHADAIAGR